MFPNRSNAYNPNSLPCSETEHLSRKNARQTKPMARVSPGGNAAECQQLHVKRLRRRNVGAGPSKREQVFMARKRIHQNGLLHQRKGEKAALRPKGEPDLRLQ